MVKISLETFHECLDSLEYQIDKLIRLNALLETQLELEPGLRYLEQSDAEIKVSIHETGIALHRKLTSLEELRKYE